MLLADFIRRSCRELEKTYPSPEARGLVLMLCGERLGVRSYTHIVEPLYEIPAGMQPGLEDDVRRLSSGEPIQYLLGHAEFCGRRFAVGPSVLIPRPETEALVAEAVRRLQPLSPGARVLDLCTGSGCIAWSVALEVPGTEVVAVDISADALALARSQFDVPAPPLFIEADVLKEVNLNPGNLDSGESGAGNLDPGSFDLLVSNPPYVMEGEKAFMRRNVLDHEPGLALFVPDDDPLVFYRAIAAWARRFLRPGGSGIVEINEALAGPTEGVFRDAGYEKTEIICDFFSKDRFVSFS